MTLRFTLASSVSAVSKNARLIWIASLALLAMTVGCANEGSSPILCSDVISYEPYVQLLYPISSASSVPTSATVLAYGSSPNGGSVTQVPIALATSNSDPAPVSLDPTALPSPLPSPNATPFADAIAYGAALPPLRSSTTYIVLAKLKQVSCGTTTEVEVNVGAFTTASS